MIENTLISAVMASSSQSSAQPSSTWSEEEVAIIQQHRDFHVKMAEYCDDLLARGRRGKEKPKPPPISLQVVLKGGFVKDTKMTPEQLHHYLCAHEKEAYNTTTWTAEFTRSLQSIEQNLSEGYKYIQFVNNGCLGIFLSYGEQLNMAYTLFLKSTEKEVFTWKDWLRIQVGIDDSYARKLRKVARELCHYPRFKKIYMPFSEVYKNINTISTMLLDPEIHRYWVTVA